MTNITSLQSTINRVKVSSINFDTFISKNDSNANVVFMIVNSDIKMNIKIEIKPKMDKNKNRNIILSVSFYHKDKEISYSDIYQSQFLVLAVAYSQYVTNLLKKYKYKQKKPLSFNLTSIVNSLKSLGKIKILLKLKEIRNILEQYQDLKAVDIYTNIKSGKKGNNNHITTIARTTIELDADFITILSKDLLINNNNNQNLLLNLHESNVYFSNYLFLYPLFRIFKAIRTLKYVISLLPAPIIAPVYTMLYPSVTGGTAPPYSDEFYIPFILSSIGIPTILFRVVSKYIFPFVVKKTIMKIK